jgi:hypothetical protein
MRESNCRMSSAAMTLCQSGLSVLVLDEEAGNEPRTCVRSLHLNDLVPQMGPASVSCSPYVMASGLAMV